MLKANFIRFTVHMIIISLQQIILIQPPPPPHFMSSILTPLNLYLSRPSLPNNDRSNSPPHDHHLNAHRSNAPPPPPNLKRTASFPSHGLSPQDHLSETSIPTSMGPSKLSSLFSGPMPPLSEPHVSAPCCHMPSI